MRKNSLSLKIVFGISFLIVFVCSLLMLISVIIFSKVQTSQVINGMTKSRDDAGKLVELAIDGYLKELDAIAQRVEIRSMNWDSQIVPLKKEAKRIGFEDFQVGSISGEIHSISGQNFNVNGNNYYIKALSGYSNISDVFYDDTYKKMVVLVSSPIRNDLNEVIGVLSAVTDASFMNKITSSVKLDYEGSCFIINDAGEKMAGVDYSGKSALENDIRNVNYTPDSNYGQYVALQIKMIQGGSDLDSFYMNNKAYFLSYIEINNGAWHLGIIQDKTQALLIIKKIVMIMLGITFIFIIFGILCGIFLSRSLKPLKSISDSITKIASGKADLTQRISLQRNHNDEVGVVVNGFNTFTEKLQNIMAVMKESKNSLVVVGNSLKSNTDNTVKSINDILVNINKIGNDTDVQTSSVEQTASSVNEISSNITSLETMIQNQSQSVAQASSAVEEMIGNIASVNKSVANMADSFKRLELKAIDGVKKQDDVSQKISIVGAESEMLDAANKVIQNISYQTNLLAMNAAIEAAHAGDSGQGFSVVAEEIRKLSDTSKEQSKTIGEQLKKIHESIESIIKASSESKVAFSSVSEEIQNTDHLVNEITIAMSEQTEGSKQINESLHNMNNSTFEVISAVDEMSKGSSAILQEIQCLQNAAFSLKESMNEMKNGAEHIKQTGNELFTISGQMEKSIYEIGLQVDQFDV